MKGSVRPLVLWSCRPTPPCPPTTIGPDLDSIPREIAPIRPLATPVALLVSVCTQRAVYGIPDDYCLSQWSNGPMSAAEARMVAAIQHLAGERSLGTPIYRGAADWAIVRDGRITAETIFSPQINGPAALDVWHTDTTITVLSAYDATLNVPLYGATVARVEVAGRSVNVQQSTEGVTITLTAGESAVLVLHHAPPSLPPGQRANL